MKTISQKQKSINSATIKSSEFVDFFMEDLHDLSIPVDLREDKERPLPPPPPPPRRIDSARSFLASDPNKNIQEDTLLDTFEYTNFESGSELEQHPGRRIMEMIKLHGDHSALKQLDAFLLEYDMNGIPDDAAAKSLDISVQAYRRLRRDHRKRLSRQIERLDVNDMLAQTLRKTEVIQQKLYRDTHGGMPADRARAAGKWADLEKMKYEVLDKNGFYKRRGFDPKEDEEFQPKQDQNDLVDLLHIVLKGGTVEDSKYHQRILDSQFDDDDEQ